MKHIRPESSMSVPEREVGTSPVFSCAKEGAEELPSPTASADVVPVTATINDEGKMVEARPAALVGVRIPSKNPIVRRRVVALFAECPWFIRADLPAAVRWGTLTEKFRRLAQLLEGLPEGGVVTIAGEPRKALGELRALSGELSRLEQALGITASARAALGVNVVRLDLASEMARRED